MTTTCQQIYVRARQSSPLNTTLVSIPSEVLARIDADQQTLFASLATATRDRFQSTALLVSTSAPSGRILDLSGISPAVERVLQLLLQTGEEVHQVDVLDIDAELAPRYYARGQTLIEVSNDWSTAGGTVTATLVYVYGPTVIDPASDYTQLISIPDAWADLLVLPLQEYFFFQRAVADRDENELNAIHARLTQRQQAFVAYLESFGGVESRRFIQPVPKESGKK